jgi:hypothetical protein
MLPNIDDLPLRFSRKYLSEHGRQAIHAVLLDGVGECLGGWFEIGLALGILHGATPAGKCQDGGTGGQVGAWYEVASDEGGERAGGSFISIPLIFVSGSRQPMGNR